jgi:hypothetical protein
MMNRIAAASLPWDRDTAGLPDDASPRATHTRSKFPSRAGSIRQLLEHPTQREAVLIFRLAAASRGRSGSATLDPTTDWSRLAQIACDEGAIGALRDHLSCVRPGLIPMELDRQLACLALDRKSKMRVLEARAAASLALLTSAGIDVALLKGAALAMIVYGSFDARPMKDIDILVDPARADEAKQLMLGAGWRRDPGLPGESVYATHHHLAPLLDSRGSQSRLEIHRALLPIGHPFALSMSELWRAMHSTSQSTLRGRTRCGRAPGTRSVTSGSSSEPA